MHLGAQPEISKALLGLKDMDKPCRWMQVISFCVELRGFSSGPSCRNQLVLSSWQPQNKKEREREGEKKKKKKHWEVFLFPKKNQPQKKKLLLQTCSAEFHRTPLAAYISCQLAAQTPWRTRAPSLPPLPRSSTSDIEGQVLGILWWNFTFFFGSDLLFSGAGWRLTKEPRLG